MTQGVVSFDPAAFKARYPEFTTLDAGLLQSYFDETALLLDNTESSRVREVEIRKPLLWMLTAHIAFLNGGANGQAPTPLVGRVASATQGSVSVSLDMPSGSANSAWYMQTKYGAAFWNATARFRTMRYLPGCSGPAPSPYLRRH